MFERPRAMRHRFGLTRENIAFTGSSRHGKPLEKRPKNHPLAILDSTLVFMVRDGVRF